MNGDPSTLNTENGASITSEIHIDLKENSAIESSDGSNDLEVDTTTPPIVKSSDESSSSNTLNQSTRN